MSSPTKSPEKDWTRLLTDPELVGHIGKLLQAYREAAPEKREAALMAAMRKIRQESAKAGTSAISTAEASTPVAAEATTTPKPPSPAVSAVQTDHHFAGEGARASHNQAAAAAVAHESTRVIEQSRPAKVEAPAAGPALFGIRPVIRPPFVPDLFTPSVGEDRRTYPRLRCFIAVELRCEGWDVPVWGNLANVSAGGCFIETVEPIRKSTKLEVGLWANNGKVWVKGIAINGVVTENNPTFGVRLRYTNMDASDRDTLRFFLKFVEDTTKSYEKTNGYVANLNRK